MYDACVGYEDPMGRILIKVLSLGQSSRGGCLVPSDVSLVSGRPCHRSSLEMSEKSVDRRMGISKSNEIQTVQRNVMAREREADSDF